MLSKTNLSLLLFVAMVLGPARQTTAAPGITPSAQDVAQKAFNATVLLVMEDANGQPLSLGSGFVLKPGEIVTNLHVVKGAASGYAKLVGQEKKYSIEGVTAVDRSRDLVVLKVEDNRWPTLELGDSDGVQVGETVFAVGNPQGLEGTFSQGIVSSIRRIGTDTLLQITAPISPGSSGGPVLNAMGEVVGVSVATFTGGQNLNFAIPAKYLLELIAAPRSMAALNQAATIHSEDSIFAGIGVDTRDSVIGNNFVYDGNTRGSDSAYSFSLVNMLRKSIRNVSVMVIFYDVDGAPIDVQSVRHSGVIESGLAKRITGYVHTSVRRINAPFNPNAQRGRVEIRILHFEIYDEAASMPRKYVVRTGDTGARIAREAGISLGDLMAANPGVDWNRISVGQVLNIPRPN